jgi:hypothetical protein
VIFHVEKDSLTKNDFSKNAPRIRKQGFNCKFHSVNFLHGRAKNAGVFWIHRHYFFKAVKKTTRLQFSFRDFSKTSFSKGASSGFFKSLTTVFSTAVFKRLFHKDGSQPSQSNGTGLNKGGQTLTLFLSGTGQK